MFWNWIFDRKKLNIFTWNIHGTYLSTLVRTGHNFYMPIKEGRPYNYDGKTPGYEWPDTVHEISVDEIKNINYDLIIFHTPQQVFEEQNLVLSEGQRKLPKIYIVHSPFREDPRNNPEKQKTLEKIDNEVLPQVNAIVHTTKYNFNQWTDIFPQTKEKSHIIYHGIPTSKVKWTGEIPKAISAVYNLPERTECGPDIYQEVASQVPITLYGFNSERFGGFGQLSNDKLQMEFAKHRVYFNSTRASSVPMAMLEAMSIGMPIVSTATTELPDIIKDGANGFISSDTNVLAEKLKLLINDIGLAKKLGQKAQKTIKDNFSIKRFIKEWNNLFKLISK